jgi:hypothetical protein
MNADDVRLGNAFLHPEPWPKLRLLQWEPVGRGALIGRARIWLPPGLEIGDVAVFEKDGRRWAQFPSEPMRERDRRPLTDANGRIRYRSSIRWANRELQERFSTALVRLVLQRHPEAFAGGAE